MNFQIPLTRERSYLIVRYLILAGLVQIGATVVCQAQQAPATKEPTFATREPRYHIGLGDIIDVEFPLVPEFNQTVTVQPDGFHSDEDRGRHSRPRSHFATNGGGDPRCVQRHTA